MTRASRRPRPGWAAILAAIVAIGAGPGAGPPEIVRVRVPADRMPELFPPDSNFTIIPFDRFEDLARRAGEMSRPSPRPRLVRARHVARWEDGQLVGRSELVIDTESGTAEGLVMLDPWSPALVGAGEGASPRATADGKLALRVGPDTPRAASVDWRLRARPGSDGRVFSFDLPDLDVSCLVIELPSGLVPEVPVGARIGPATGPSPGTASWTIEAARGRVDLRLRGPIGGGADASGTEGAWVGGSVRIDLAASPANWKGEWTVVTPPGSASTLDIDLDAGLEFVDVAGPRVASSRVQANEATTRVVVALSDDGPEVFPLTLRAIARVPAEGAWVIPSARFPSAVWTGDRTTIYPDPSRVVDSCVEKNGLRVAPRSDSPPGRGVLAFEATAAGPVAELTFRRPEPSATVDVRGLLRLGEEAPRLEAAMTWTVEAGWASDLAADLPPGWSPDRAVGPDGAAIPWHAEPNEFGGTRVRLRAAPSADAARPITTTVHASAAGMGADGPIDLPRVLPASAGSRAAEESWAAILTPGLTLRPVEATGLAWIDTPASGRPPAETSWNAADQGAALAWRWSGDDEARARVDRLWDRPEPRAEMRSIATIAGGRLRVSWTLAVEASDGPVVSIPLHSDQAIDPPLVWKPVDPADPLMEVRPIDAADHAANGFPEVGHAWELRLSRPGRGRLEFQAHLDLPWSGQGSVPILSLPGRFRPRGLVAVDVESTARVRVEPVGLSAIDPSEGSAGSKAGLAVPPPAGRLRRSSLLVRRGPEAHLRVSAQPVPPGSIGGVVREATLTTLAHPGVGARHRLTLRIAVDTARSIEFTMPPGSSPDRVRRDGMAVAVTPSRRSIAIPLPAPTASRPTCTLSLDYRTDDEPGAGRLDPSEMLPSCSLPCMSFVWELTLPRPWEPADFGPGLVSTESRPRASWSSLLLGLPSAWWRRPAPIPPAKAGAAVLRDLEAVAEGIPPGETTLGEWLLRLDAGRRAVIVDRLALASAGLGPRSRLDPAAPPNAVATTLKMIGLAVVPIGGRALITSRVEAPDLASANAATAADRLARIGRAATALADASDRYQAAPRWWGEATPSALAVGELPERAPDSSGWRTWRLVSGRWPAPHRSSVELVDAGRSRWLGWMACAAVVSLGLAARGCPARWRARGLASAGLVATLGIASSWPEPSPTATGLARGVLAVLALWAGASLRAPASSLSSSRGREGRSGVGASRVAATLAVVALAVTTPASAVAPEAPILAVLAYDGPPDLDARPDRVALLLTDFDRLARLARPGGLVAPPVATLTAARHEVSREAGGSVMVESVYDVWVEGAGEAAWTLPIGPGRDLEASIDGRPIPLAVAADGQSASVTFNGPGAHALRFRRRVPPSPRSGGESIRVPINRAAFARIAIDRGDEELRVDAPAAMGPLSVRDGKGEGPLGPAETLEVRWLAGASAPSGFAGPVESATLWDIRPGGDLVRARFTHDEADGVSTIRLAVEPGVAIRDSSIPNVVAVRREGTEARPEWVAHVAPPWPKGVPIEVVAWKPRPSDGLERRLPRVEIVGAARLSGSLALRRPADWTGRLSARGGYEAWDESAFIRAWGPLPDDGPSLSGAVRFERRPPPPPTVVSAPAPSERSARTAVQVHPRAGRLDATIETNLSDRQGHRFEAEATLPDQFRILSVEGEGLTSWRRSAPGRLTLRFDGPESPERRLRIHGSLPARDEGGPAESHSFEGPIPWPSWDDVEEEAGVLSVSGQVRYPADPEAGVVALAPSMPEEPIAGRPSPAYYRVERPRALAPIRWASPPARVDVEIDSDLTIFPSSVAWSAAIRCDISGGPAAALTWTLPTAWARHARVEIPGQSHRLDVSEEGETTRWTVVPDVPFWGRSHLVLRADRPLAAGEEFLFPGLAPFAAPGRGAVERYELGIANLSGLPLEVAGSPGLREADASRHLMEDSPVPSGSADRAFLVSGDRWSLRVKVGQGRPSPRPTADEETIGVLEAQLACALDLDGSGWGRATYELGHRPAPFLAVRLPRGAEVPWASVDGRIVPTVRDGADRWLIPIEGRNARRACLVWHVPPIVAPRDGAVRAGLPVALPTLEQEEVPTLVTVAAPGSMAVSPDVGGLERIAPPTWDVEDADRLARRIIDDLADFDRDSPDDRGAVVADLVEFELRARALDRAEAARTPAERASADTRSARLLSARAAIAESTQATGLDGLIEEARAVVGLAAEGGDLFRGTPSDSSSAIRIRRIGDVSFFRGFGPSPRRPRGLAWAPRPDPSRRAWSEPGIVLGVGLAASVGLAQLVDGLGRPGRRATYATLAAIALGLLAWVPVAGAACLAMALVGRFGNSPG